MTRRRRRALALCVAAALVAGTVAVVVSEGHRSDPLGGSVSYGSFRSRALDGIDHYSIYVPRDYARSHRRYRVIYYLHGLPDQPDAYKSIEPIADAVAASGDNAIVVGAQGDRNGDADPEWLDHGPGRDWETATAVELVKTIDSRYRTIRERSGRILIGISAGGYGATLIGSHNPATYSVVESWSGYFHPTNPAGTASLELGSGEANDWADFYKLIPTLAGLYGRWWGQTWFGFYVGTDDPRFRAENQRMYQKLRAARVPHVLFRLYQGGHDWSLWERHAVTWVRAALNIDRPG